MKKLVLIIAVLLGFSIQGQDLEILNYSGIEQTVLRTQLDESIIEFQSYFNHDSGIRIYDYNAYPISLYLDKEEGLEVAEKNMIAAAKKQSEYYLLFVTRHSEEKLASHIEVYHNLPLDQISSKCNTSYSALFSLAQSNLNSDLDSGEIGSSSNKAKVDYFNFLNGRFSNGCEMEGDDWIPEALRLEFDIISIPELKIVYPGESYVPQGAPQDQRMQCGISDYTGGTLRYEVNGANRKLESLLQLANGDINFTNRTLILTHKDLENGLTLGKIIDGEINQQACEQVTIIFFPGKFNNPNHNVLVRTIKKGEDIPVVTQINFTEVETFIKSLDTSDFFKIDFRFANYKEQILGYCELFESGDLSSFISQDLENLRTLFLTEKCEYQLGLVSGIGDGLIETVDFLSVAVQYLGKAYFNMRLNSPTSSLFWSDLILYGKEKRSIKLAFEHKFGDAWDYWVGNVEAIINVFDGIGDKVMTLLGALWNMAMKWYQDASFKNGTYQAGYAHGKVIFEVLIEIALGVTTGGAGNFAKGVLAFTKSATESGKVVKHFVKKLKDASPTKAQLDEMAYVFARNAKVLSNKTWRWSNQVIDEVFGEAFLRSPHLVPVLASNSIQLAGTKVDDLFDSGKIYIQKVANESDDLLGKIDEIDTGNGGIIYQDAGVGNRGLIAVAEKTTNNELVAKLLATLPSDCSQVLNKFPQSLLIDLGHIGPDGLTIASKIRSFKDLKAFNFLSKSNLDNASRLNVEKIHKLGDDLGDATKGKALEDFLELNVHGVKAWDLVKHLDEGVKLNVSALGKLDNLLTSGKIPKVKLESALNSHLGDILNAADEVNVGKILDRLNLQHVDEIHFDKIRQRLDDYPTLRQDLIDNPNWFETFEDILDNPGRYWDIVDEAELPNNAALTKWGQGFWWKNLRDLAKNFEDGAALNNFKSVNGISNNSNVVTQVTLEVNGTKIRIDYLGKDASGKFHLGDAKFTTKDKNWNLDWLSASTTNQNTVFPLFEPPGGINSIVVKATDPVKIQQLQALGLANNSTISFSNTSMKIFGSAPNQQSVQTVVTLKN